MNTLKFKREKIDFCNICLQKKDLSWDHIPPKGGVELTSMEINEIYKFMTITAPKPKISQNGVKYRFICKDCNSKLGKYYDSVLNDFTISIGRFLRSKLIFPRVLKIKTRPKALVKSILGHIISAKTIIDDVDLDNKVRKFIFDDSAILDKDIHVYYWIYPYDCVVIMRDFVMSSKRADIGLGSVGFFNLVWSNSSKLCFEK